MEQNKPSRIKPGFHVIAVIAVIVVIAPKKLLSDGSDHMETMNLTVVVIFAIAELILLSDHNDHGDRSDYMETRLNRND